MPIKFWQTIVSFWFFLSYLITTVVTVKSTVEISKNFVAFSEYMNFKVLCWKTWLVSLWAKVTLLQ